MYMEKSLTKNEKDTSRVEAFSDGVIAIAITLLVLELKVPDTDSVAALAKALLAEWPSYFAFLLSFMTIGIMWVNHHRIFNLVRRVDHKALILNAALLLTISVVPFPTALVAHQLGHPGDWLAVLIYSLWGLIIALVFTALWRYIVSPKNDLLNVPYSHPEVVAIHKQYRYGPVFYVVATLISLWHPIAGIVACAVIALFFLLPPQKIS